jgi:hypothetical protein
MVRRIVDDRLRRAAVGCGGSQTVRLSLVQHFPVLAGELLAVFVPASSKRPRRSDMAMHAIFIGSNVATLLKLLHRY